MNITVIGIGSASSPSTRFRFHQYADLFAEAGHQLNFVYKYDIDAVPFWQALANADIIINQKCLLGKRYARRIFNLGKPVFFDFDDAIWTRPGKPYSWLTQRKVDRRLARWLSGATGVMVANSFLAEKAAQYSRNVEVIPMALDTERWKPAEKRKAKDRIFVGWNGGPNNLPLLEQLNPLLKAFLRQHPQVEMHVFCGKKPCFDFPYEYHSFSVEREIPFVQSLDIGLLPLESGEHSDGKSPIKALQYMACGVPVVGNFNRGGAGFLINSTCIKVLSVAQWAPALERLVYDDSFRKSLALNGRNMAQDAHSVTQVFVKFKKFLLCD